MLLSLLAAREEAEPLAVEAGCSRRPVVGLLVAGARVVLVLVRQDEAERAWVLAATAYLRGLHPGRRATHLGKRCLILVLVCFQVILDHIGEAVLGFGVVLVVAVPLHLE